MILLDNVVILKLLCLLRVPRRRSTGYRATGIKKGRL